MKKYRNLIALSFLIVLFFSCKKISGEGPVVTETRNVATFSEIQSEISGDVFVTEDSILNIKIEGQQNITDQIETNVNDGILTIRVKHNVQFGHGSKLKIYVTMPHLTGLCQRGSGNMQINDAIHTDEIYLKVSGSGNIYLNSLTADKLKGTISGSGSLSVYNGVVNEEKLQISGSGAIDVQNMKAAKGSVKISGSGNASVFVTETLEVDISGSGNVYYKGNPALDISINGSGKLKNI